VLADRVDRRNLLMAGQAVMAAGLIALGVLVVTGLVQVWHGLLVAGLQGAMRATQPARASLSYDLVGRSAMQNAMASQFAATGIASAIGPVIGGFILAAFGPGPLFISIGTLAALSAVLLSRVKTPPRSYPTATSVWANLKEGVAFSLRDRPIRGVLSLIVLTELCGFAVLSMLPVVARDVLAADGRVLGLLMAMWGTGGMITALTLALRADIQAKGWLFVGSACTLGMALLLFSLSRNLPLSLALLLVAGGAGALYDTMANTLLQTLAPDALRGRVSGLYSLLLSGGSLGALGRGAVAEYRGVAFAITLGGGIVATNAARVMPMARALGSGRVSQVDVSVKS
jgi:MFS family permease